MSVTHVTNLSKIVKPIDPLTHTMPPDRLLRYLEIKVHHLIQESDWERINIVGNYDRGSMISRLEKNDKAFNWQRPSVETEDGTLTLNCFPGRDYAEHYGLIVATYLEMTGKYKGQVHVYMPLESVCDQAIDRLRLDASKSDLVVVGWGLGAFTDDSRWNYGPGYAWKSERLGDASVLYLGYLHSIWGDVAGRVVTRLAELGARRVVYVGKVGCLDASVEPNTALATGNTSRVDGRDVTWRDFFATDLADRPNVLQGLHVTSASILLETKAWLAGHQDALFVDPEIGRMGQAAATADIEFGYLHLVSNNLARECSEDLSNERNEAVLRQRSVLVQNIRAEVARRLQKVTR